MSVNGEPNKPSQDAKAPAKEALDELTSLIKAGKQEQAQSVLESYFEYQSGPLPSARELLGYENLLPGAAERILAMAEREQTQRHELELTIVRTEVVLKRRGQWMALSALVSMLSLIAVFVYLGAPRAGAGLGVVIVASVVYAFLNLRKFGPSGPRQDGSEPERRNHSVRAGARRRKNSPRAVS